MNPRAATLRITPLWASVFGLCVAAAAIGGAWLFQLAGYLPCELCLKERWPYYVGVPYAALCVALCAAGPKAVCRPALALLALLFAGSAAFGAYHAGVEWGFWQGPTGCTGPLTSPASMSEFLQQLHTVKVVRCDAVAIRIFGLSLAGWNAVASTAVAVVAAIGAAGARN